MRSAAGTESRGSESTPPASAAGEVAADSGTDSIASAFVLQAGAAECRRVSTRQPWHRPALDIFASCPTTSKRSTDEPTSPLDSLIGIRLPFGSSPELRERYLSYEGQIRFGKLLQDMDALAGHISYAHCGIGEEDVLSGRVTVVTASCDRIDLLANLQPDVDMLMIGCCTYVGRSSLNVDIELAEENPQPGKARVAFIKASFTFVARDEDNNAMEVPRLVTNDERTRSWYLKGQSRQNARKQFRALSLTNQPPTHSELELVYELFMSPVHKQNSAATNGATKAAAAPVRVHSNATTMSTTLICHPQNRNIHGKVFGGYLMRHAFELAWITARNFAGKPPVFVALDDIQFRAPVSIGDVISFTASVEYSQGYPHRTMSVAVSTAILDPVAESTRITNDFHFTFRVDGVVNAVVPSTFADAMRYIEAMRRQQRGLALAAEREQSKVEGGAPRLKFFSPSHPIDASAAL